MLEAHSPKKVFKGKKRTMSEVEADEIYRKAYGPPPGEL
jgi:hypothetical protein